LTVASSKQSPVIAIDYTPAYEQGAGIGRLVRDLVAALAKQDAQTPYRLFVAGASAAHLPAPPAANFTWRTTTITPQWWARIWQRVRLPYAVDWLTGPVHLYHATDFVLPPTRRQTRTILTVHDLSFARVPESASPKLRAYLDVVVPRSIARADHVIADSQATKDDIIALYNTPAAKITVLLSGVDPRFQHVADPQMQQHMRDKYGIDSRPFVLSVGTVQPRKNYSRLIESLSALRARGYDVQLVVAGGKGWLEDEMYQTITRLGMAEHVRLIGYVNDEDLPALYSAATCIAYPSLYEGFGFPILEGMACHTPVVTANVSSLPEVAGDAAIMVDPLDTDALTNALRRVLDDSNLRQDLIQRGAERVKQFTWANAATNLREIYQHVLSTTL
jgi:glycosyltransferase involved in cell wall biosynthesis